MTYLLLCSQHSNNFTTSSAKWHFHYCVHNSPILNHVLSLIIHLLLCSQQSTASQYPKPNDTTTSVFVAVHYLTMSSGKWHISYCVHSTPLLVHVLSQMLQLLQCSQQSTAWTYSEPNNTPFAVFTAVHRLTMFWVQSHTYCCAHNIPPLDHVLSQMTRLLQCSQQSNAGKCSEPNNKLLLCSKQSTAWPCSEPNKQLLLCPQQSTAWPCSEPNYTPVVVFTTVDHLTMFSAKWYIYYCV